MKCETPVIALYEDSNPVENPFRRWLKPALQCILMLALSYGAYAGVSRYLYQSVEVVGESMEPTLHPADQLILNRFAYRIQEPKQLDVVVLKDPTDGAFVVKRIIARPGDAVFFRSGNVFVNGHLLREPYVMRGAPTLTGSGVQEQLVVCGKDQYFVLGDNRQNSFDSRMYGPVRRQNILGLVSL